MSKKKKIIKFVNDSGRVFDDVSSEEFRQYNFPNGGIYIVENPLMLNVSGSGGHRLFDAQGLSHYVQPQEGWSIVWKARRKQPNFVK